MSFRFTLGLGSPNPITLFRRKKMVNIHKKKKHTRYPFKPKAVDYLMSSLEYELRLIEMMRCKDGRKRNRRNLSIVM